MKKRKREEEENQTDDDQKVDHRFQVHVWVSPGYVVRVLPKESRWVTVPTSAPTIEIDDEYGFSEHVEHHSVDIARMFPTQKNAHEQMMSTVLMALPIPLVRIVCEYWPWWEGQRQRFYLVWHSPPLKRSRPLSKSDEVQLTNLVLTKKEANKLLEMDIDQCILQHDHEEEECPYGICEMTFAPTLRVSAR